MLLPFLLQLVTSICGKSKMENEDTTRESATFFKKLASAFLTFFKKLPSAFLTSIHCLPVLQTFFNIRRFFILKDQLVHTSDPAKMIKTQKEGLKLGIFEAVAEAGPTQVLNLCIFFMTGSLTTTQTVSLVSSFISLSTAGVAVFYLYRSHKEEDANPHIILIVLTFLPMLFNTVASTLLWAIIAAFGNVLIVPCFLLVIMVTYTTLAIMDYFSDSDGKESNYSLLEIALLNAYQPVAIGGHKFMLVISAVATYGTRLILIIILWTCQAYRWRYAFDFLKLKWTPSLLTCVEPNSTAYLEANKTNTCNTTSSCFCWTSCETSKIEEQIR